MHIVGFTIEIYYDARSYERQIQMHQARFESQIYVMGYPSEKLPVLGRQFPRGSQPCELKAERGA